MRSGPRSGQSFDLVWDSEALLNGHTILVGGSGSGKTHQLRRIVTGLGQAGIRVHVIDVHGDVLPACATDSIRFSESTEFGLNPLEVSADPDFGGPRKRANAFISLMLRQATLGEKQKSALFRLLVDLYKRFGFELADPATWSLDYDPRPSRSNREARADDGYSALPNLDWFSLSDTEKTELKRKYGLKWNGGTKVWQVATSHPEHDAAVAQWGGGNRKRQPVLSDLQREVYHRLVSLKLTGGTSAARSLEEVMRLQRRARGLKVRYLKGDDVEGQLAKVKDELLDAMEKALDRLETGEELDELIAWDSADAIKGLYDRICNLQQTGIFRGSAPEFDARKPVWRYDISPLSREEAQFFVDCLCAQIFAAAKQRGEADGPDTAIVIDEAAAFLCKDDDHILTIIAREARKFGIMLVLATQELGSFSPAVIASTATKVILGVDEMYHRTTETKLGLETGKLKFIRPQETALVQLKNRGKGEGLSNRFWEVHLVG
jgi:hypothetical protein